MHWQTDKPFLLQVGDTRLEARCWGPSPDKSPTIIMLHEGLGSVGQWKDFPEMLSSRTGYGVFAYSRAGYGNSDAISLPRPLDYMTREAMQSLPLVLDAIGFERGILLGHSDGASIATIYAGGVEDFRIRGVCLLAPHFFTEPMGLAAIREAKLSYDNGQMRQRLAKYHKDPDTTFRGWNDAWLDEGFLEWNIEEYIQNIRVPVLAIQGSDDQYGTIAQIHALENALYSPIDVAILPGCKHSPYGEQPDATAALIGEYVDRLDEIEAVSMTGS